MGDKETKLKLEIGDYKFECRGEEKAMIELAVQNLQNYKKAIDKSSY